MISQWVSEVGVVPKVPVHQTGPQRSCIRPSGLIVRINQPDPSDPEPFLEFVKPWSEQENGVKS